MKRRLEVDLDRLQDAFESANELESSWYFDLETGEVVFVTQEMKDAYQGCVAGLEGWDGSLASLAAALAEAGTAEGDVSQILDVAKVERLPLERMVLVPTRDSNEDFEDMQAFASSLPEGRSRQRLLDALARRRPFRGFKTVLGEFPAEREAWFAFHDERVRVRLIAWLEELEIEPAAAKTG